MNIPTDDFDLEALWKATEPKSLDLDALWEATEPRSASHQDLLLNQLEDRCNSMLRSIRLLRLQMSGTPVGSSNPALAKPLANGSIPTNAQELLKRLEAECPELLKLVKAPPIRLVGKQRTGKSTFARKLVLLRAILLSGHTVAWATPHRELDNPVPSQLNPFGTTQDGAKDFNAIETVWTLVQNAIDRGQQLNLSVCWDEFGSYDQFEDEQLLSKSLRSLLREATKHGYHPILVAHGDQATFYPGISGILTTLKDSSIKVETIGTVANSFGEMKPTGEVEVTHIDGSISRFKVPDWLTVDLLLGMLPGNTRPDLLDAIAHQQVKPPVSKYQYEFEAEEFEEVKEESPQERIAKKIADKLKAANGDWVSSRELVSRTFRTDNDKSIATQILNHFVQKGTLERQRNENPNGTITESFRVASSSSNNIN